jgi:tetratricopeptide (TPR) repeat protein
MLGEAVQLQRDGRFSEAIASYERLLQSWPGLPNCWYELGLLQRKVGKFTAALASYQEALERQVTMPEEVHLNRGIIYSDCLYQYDAAQRELNAALGLNPGYVPALINLANLHEDLGRRDQAAEVYERILAIAPESPVILARYAGLKTFSDPNDALILRLRAVLAKPGINDADRANVEFALGRALDACAAYDEAFRVYTAANRHSRDSVGAGFRAYDLRVEEQSIDRLIAAFPDSGFNGYGPRIYSPRESPPQPVFVCGMFRSGSTLLEQLLAGHPRVGAGGELPFLSRAVQTRLAPYPESMASIQSLQVETLSAEYLDMIHELFPAADYVTDKRPDNFRHIGLIKMLFPKAKIIHTTRAALDNCLSVYFLHLDQGMSYALDLMDIGHYYIQYRRLMAHWKALFQSDILDVSYDALVADTRPVMERALEFLGLDWDEGCLSAPRLRRAVKTASVWQVREPVYQRSSGRSVHYERQLRLLREYIALHS